MPRAIQQDEFYNQCISMLNLEVRIYERDRRIIL